MQRATLDGRTAVDIVGHHGIFPIVRFGDEDSAGMSEIARLRHALYARNVVLDPFGYKVEPSRVVPAPRLAPFGGN